MTSDRASTDSASSSRVGFSHPVEEVSRGVATRTDTSPASTEPARDVPKDSEPPVRKRRPFRFTLKLLAFVTVIYYFVLPRLPQFRDAFGELGRITPALLVGGLGLELLALWCYAPLMRAALGQAGDGLRLSRLFRIQMSTRALSSIVPGGSAASSALGFRLLTLSGVAGADAGFALAAVGLGSAVVLNLILWVSLLVSIPIRGVNPIYGTAALVGVLVMGIVAVLIFGLMEGQGRSERAVRWIAIKLHMDPDKAEAVLQRLAERLEQLFSDRQLMVRVAFWATLNWLLDAAALWVFLRAFGITMQPDALIIAFGLANVMAAIPITPGGLGYVDTGYVAMLSGFGAPADKAALGVASYRFAQFFFPILLGGVMYMSLRVGPWKIERRDRLDRLRDLADAETMRGESKIDFQLRIPTRDEDGQLIRPQSTSHQAGRSTRRAQHAIQHANDSSLNEPANDQAVDTEDVPADGGSAIDID